MYASGCFDGFSGSRSSAEIVTLLLDRGADPNAIASSEGETSGATALLSATRFGTLTVMRILLEHHADVNQKRPGGQTPLAEAARIADAESIKLLLEYHALPNLPAGPFDAPPFYQCVASQAADRVIPCLQILLAGKADVNAYTRGHTALTDATMFGKLDLVCFLLEHGANPNLWEDLDSLDRPRHRQGTALHRSGTEAITKALLTHGADPNARGEDGVTPLMLAASWPQAQLLIKYGARTDEVDGEGIPVIGHGVMNHRADLVGELIRRGRTLRFRSSHGDGPLHLLFSNVPNGSESNAASDTANVKSLVKWAVLAGISIEERNSAGETALHLAAECGRTSYVRILLQMGARIKPVDKKGKSAVDHAVAKQQVAVADLLRDATTLGTRTFSTDVLPSFWNQYQPATSENRNYLIAIDPSPSRQWALEDFAIDLLVRGFSEWSGSPREFWAHLPENERKALRERNKSVIRSYRPVWTYTPITENAFDLKFLDRIAQLDKASGWSNNDTLTVPDWNSLTSGDSLDRLHLEASPLLTSSGAELLDLIPKSFGQDPAALQRQIRDSFLFGTLNVLYGGTASKGDQPPAIETVRKGLSDQLERLGANLIRLYEAQRPFLTLYFGRLPAIQLQIVLSSLRTSAVPGTDSSGRRLITLRYADVIDCFHASIRRGFLKNLTATDLLGSFMNVEQGQIPSSLKISSLSETYSSFPEMMFDEIQPEDLTAPEAVRRLQLLHAWLNKRHPLSLSELEMIGPAGKVWGRIIRSARKLKTPPKNAEQFLASYEPALKQANQELKRLPHDEASEENDGTLYERNRGIPLVVLPFYNWLGEFVLYNGLQDAARRVEEEFNNVLLFALAHELGHQALGTAGREDVEAERQADAFAVTLLASSFAEMSLTELSMRSAPGADPHKQEIEIVTDGRRLLRLLGYSLFFDGRLQEDRPRQAKTGVYDAPAVRSSKALDRFRQLWPSIQRQLVGQRKQSYAVSHAVTSDIDKFQEVVTFIAKDGKK